MLFLGHTLHQDKTLLVAGCGDGRHVLKALELGCYLGLQWNLQIVSNGLETTNYSDIIYSTYFYIYT